ncbi:MAG: hypothetical protein R3E48_05390 [Burkholderiaceae bacterium]
MRRPSRKRGCRLGCRAGGRQRTGIDAQGLDQPDDFGACRHHDVVQAQREAADLVAFLELHRLRGPCGGSWTRLLAESSKRRRERRAIAFDSLALSLVSDGRVQAQWPQDRRRFGTRSHRRACHRV